MQEQIAQSFKQKALNQDTNNLLEWIERQSEVKETDLTYILRWEDDGGFIIQPFETVSQLP
ncbi:MAG TPA: hypothetical protein V6D26_04105 [Stenomitos sp.]